MPDENAIEVTEAVPEVFEPGYLLNSEVEPELPKDLKGRLNHIEKSFKFAIATFGHEIYLMNPGGRWCIQTGDIEKLILRFGINPENGLLSSLIKWTRVDPNNTGESIYFYRRPDEPWRPLSADTADVICRTGVYNIKTRTFEPLTAIVKHDDALIFGPTINMVPDPKILDCVRRGDHSAAPDKFKALIGMIEYALDGDADTVRYFRQTVAQVLRPHAGVGSFCHVVGESGCRKTTILRVLLSAPCGSAGLSETSEELLADGPFNQSVLAHKVANLSNDSATSKKFSNWVKECTSGVLRCERKFRDPVKIRMTARLFATMNTPQNYSDDSLGIEKRLVAFRFKERNDNNTSPEGLQWRDDPSFYDEESRCWINHWLLVALESLIDSNGVEQSPGPSEAAKRFKESLLNEASPIREFTGSQLKFEAGLRVPIKDVIDRAIATGHCHDADTDRKAFGQQLGKFLQTRFKVGSRPTRIEGAQVRVYDGVALKVLEQ